jgi:hypothetical protein
LVQWSSNRRPMLSSSMRVSSRISASLLFERFA